MDENPYQSPQADAWEPGAKPTAGPGRGSFYTDLYKTLREGAPLVITPHDVRRQMRVIEESHRQAGL